MTRFIVHLVVSALLLLLVAHFIPGITVNGFGFAVLAALVLGVVNGIVRPILILLTLPITVLTMGLFLFVINALMLMLAAAIVPGFAVEGLVPALLGGLLLAVFNLTVSIVFGK